MKKHERDTFEEGKVAGASESLRSTIRLLEGYWRSLLQRDVPEDLPTTPRKRHDVLLQTLIEELTAKKLTAKELERALDPLSQQAPALADEIDNQVTSRLGISFDDISPNDFKSGCRSVCQAGTEKTGYFWLSLSQFLKEALKARPRFSTQESRIYVGENRHFTRMWSYLVEFMEFENEFGSYSLNVRNNKLVGRPPVNPSGPGTLIILVARK